MKIPFCTDFVQILPFFLVGHTKNLLRNFKNKLSVNEDTEKNYSICFFLFTKNTQKYTEIFLLN